MNATLLLRLEGPFQSWGSQARFSILTTEREPTKSGVVGLLCAAMGVTRDDRTTIGQLADGAMTVRVDREGAIERDYHTTGGGAFGDLSHAVYDAKTRRAEHTVPTERYYLADASFLVALEHDEALLVRVKDALRSPVWPLSLGRKACVPACPVFESLEQASASECVRKWPRAERAGDDTLRLLIESTPERGQPRDDVPVTFQPRVFRRRYVEIVWTDPPAARRIA